MSQNEYDINLLLSLIWIAPMQEETEMFYLFHKYPYQSYTHYSA